MAFRDICVLQKTLPSSSIAPALLGALEQRSWACADAQSLYAAMGGAFTLMLSGKTDF